LEINKISAGDVVDLARDNNLTGSDMKKLMAAERSAKTKADIEQSEIIKKIKNGDMNSKDMKMYLQKRILELEEYFQKCEEHKKSLQRMHELKQHVGKNTKDVATVVVNDFMDIYKTLRKQYERYKELLKLFDENVSHE
jgi:DNA-binding transcriptional MerR regulator